MLTRSAQLHRWLWFEITRRIAPRSHLSYASWASVAGFFDGDGGAEEVIGDYVVSARLEFSDNWRYQLQAVESFLEGEGIKSARMYPRIWKGKKSSRHPKICNVAGVLKMARNMLPHSVKKRAELQAIVDYLDDRITGDELVRLVNKEIWIGNKLGKLKSSDLPMTRSEANIQRRRRSLLKAHAAYDTAVSEAERTEIQRLYKSGHYSMRQLGRIFGHKHWVIERILGK